MQCTKAQNREAGRMNLKIHSKTSRRRARRRRRRRRRTGGQEEWRRRERKKEQMGEEEEKTLVFKTIISQSVIEALT